MSRIIKSKTMLFMILMAAAVFMVLTSNASAVSETGRTNYTLTKGVTESVVYATESGNENVRIHILRVNKGANISFKVSTAQYYKKNSTKAQRTAKTASWKAADWGFADVGKQAKNYEKTKDKKGTVIAASNGDFYLKGDLNGMTEGNLIMEGNQLRDNSARPFFAVTKSGKYEIRHAGASTAGVEEAVGGYLDLVKNGKVVVGKKAGSSISHRHPCQAIGVTADETVVIANIDGREPTSIGTSWFNLATVLKQQGCKNAIMLDGGGSATFMTKRAKGKLAVRNTLMEGFIRNVSSSILVVKNSKGSAGKIKGKAVVSMKSKKTKLTKSKKGYSYKINGKAKKTEFVVINGETYLFNKKGKGISKVVQIGGNEYTFKKGKLTKSSDKKAGAMIIGYCGAKKGGRNLIFAYHYGDNKLNIGLNPFVKKNGGQMENWDNQINVPWSVEKYNVKNVEIGNGVTNVGSRFLCVTLNPFNDNMKGIKTSLKSVKLPKSLKEIGMSTFYNHYHLKKVQIPAKVKMIGANAFYYNNGASFDFSSKKPPKMEKNSFLSNQKTKKKTIFNVPNNKAWKKFAKNKKVKKLAKFKGKIKFKKAK